MDHTVSPLEQKLDELATLYFAARQLHSTLSLAEVGRQVSDVVGQLIGANQFVVYVMEKGGATAKAGTWFNLPDARFDPVEVGKGPIGTVLATMEPNVPEQLSAGTVDEPLAVIPLLAEGKAIGAVSIVTMLSHKVAWTSIDLELLRLLQTHAGPALIAASLFQRVDSPESALEEALAALPQTARVARFEDSDESD